MYNEGYQVTMPTKYNMCTCRIASCYHDSLPSFQLLSFSQILSRTNGYDWSALSSFYKKMSPGSWHSSMYSTGSSIWPAFLMGFLISIHTTSLPSRGFYNTLCPQTVHFLLGVHTCCIYLLLNYYISYSQVYHVKYCQIIGSTLLCSYIP